MRLPMLLLLFPIVASADPLAEAVNTFAESTGGVRLVFERGELPKGGWYDELRALDAEGRLAAARIAVEQARMYPPGYLRGIGLSTIGLFAACVSKTGDGFRPYEVELDGYRFYGMWNGRDALVAAHYTDEQLPLTFHHEVFHHVDATTDGRTRPGHLTADDARFEAVIGGRRRYPPPTLPLDALRDRAAGYELEDAVGAYSRKNPGEDQAETARYLMSALPDALLQAAERPTLPGSQRILHVLAAYERALPDADLAWFRDVALGRADARRALAEVRRRTRARAGDADFTVWGREAADGVNHTLRRDLRRFGETARAARGLPDGERARVLLGSVRLLARYRAYIASRWSITPGTEAAFERALDGLRAALPTSRATLAAALERVGAAGLAGLLSSAVVRAPNPTATLVADAAAAGHALNPHLASVDAEIDDAALRARIRRVQAATVRVGGGSGVNIGSGGRVLTAAHVVDRPGRQMEVEFPDGRKVAMRCTHFDRVLDLALLEAIDAVELPTAAVAPAAPDVGDPVVVIGQPGTRTPGGEPTGYTPFHVSVGEIRGFLPDRLGPQALGRAKHDAWTYWGHSGSPLFDARGRIVAMHNSWDPETAMRHAVTHEAIVHFLRSTRAAR